ncbi:hypothetical protein FOCC_FOCC006720, partial [Frankliniella occidentalis]
MSVHTLSPVRSSQRLLRSCLSAPASWRSRKLINSSCIYAIYAKARRVNSRVRVPTYDPASLLQPGHARGSSSTHLASTS